MSIKNNKVPVPGHPNYGNAYVISSHIPDNLVGKVLTIIESIGLKDSQEKALKDIIRSTIYGAFDEGFMCSWIEEQFHDKIKSAIYEIKDNDPDSYITDYNFKVSYELK